jgi:AraC-like DNA-binding protein
MTELVSILTWTVVVFALLQLFVLLARRDTSVAALVYAVFAGSLAMSMLRPELRDSPTWLTTGLVIGGCVTCNGYWLFARALFRGDKGVRGPQVAVAIGIALLILLRRGLDTPGTANLSDVLGGFLTLASSSMLVLGFVEALRGWTSTLAPPERRLRLGFMAVYGSCVLAATAASALVDADPSWQPMRQLVVVACALSILAYSPFALGFRRRHPLAAATAGIAGVATACEPRTSSGRGDTNTVELAEPEDRVLAAAIVHALDTEALHRDPDLRVADLARRLGSSEHRISRAISLALPDRNFNQLINRYRITDAARLLATAPGQPIIDIAHASGFASLGPFNRAFKATMGCTPSAYRASRPHAIEDRDIVAEA